MKKISVDGCGTIAIMEWIAANPQEAADLHCAHFLSKRDAHHIGVCSLYMGGATLEEALKPLTPDMIKDDVFEYCGMRRWTSPEVPFLWYIEVNNNVYYITV